MPPSPAAAVAKHSACAATRAATVSAFARGVVGGSGGGGSGSGNYDAPRAAHAAAREARSSQARAAVALVASASVPSTLLALCDVGADLCVRRSMMPPASTLVTRGRDGCGGGGGGGLAARRSGLRKAATDSHALAAAKVVEAALAAAAAAVAAAVVALAAVAAAAVSRGPFRESCLDTTLRSTLRFPLGLSLELKTNGSRAALHLLDAICRSTKYY